MDSNTALANVQAGVQNAQSPDQVLNQQMQATGAAPMGQQVAGLRSAIANTSGILSSIAPRVSAESQNSLQTTAQGNKIAQNQEAPVESQLAGNVSKYQNANADYMPLLDTAQGLAGQKITAQEGQQKTLEQLYKDTYAKELNAQNQSNQTRAQAAQAAASARASRGSRGGGGSSSGGAPANTDVVSRIQQLADSGAGWGDVARQLDEAFGQGTATKFDDAFKVIYGIRDKGTAFAFGGNLNNFAKLQRS